jgi:IS5 family transposase
MMGPAQRRQPKLFYTAVNLEDRLRPDHPLRAIGAMIDFDFVRQEVADRYGNVGNPSVDPAVVLKLMFLLFYERVGSERQLAGQLGERLDWLWFCGYDLDSDLPHHSVLSKARRRWGKELFTRFFERVVWQCVEQGLVDGSTVYADGSVIAACAGKDSLGAALRLRGRQVYDDLEATCDEAPRPATPISTTDPEARLTRKNGQTILGYKDHRVVDDRCGIITATITTDAAVPEAAPLIEAIEQHEQNTQQAVAVVTADKGYGTAKVYRDLQQRRTTPCIPHKQATEAAAGKFRREQFIYDPTRDRYTCPAGATLVPRGPASEGRYRYQAPPGTCERCPLREPCTDNPRGRLLSRHVNQEAIDWADAALCPKRRRELMRRRKHKIEGSFADATNRHGYKRARWRGLAWMTVQNLLIATVQNIRKLLRHTRPRPHVGAPALRTQAAPGPLTEAPITTARAASPTPVPTPPDLWTRLERVARHLGDPPILASPITPPRS